MLLKYNLRAHMQSLSLFTPPKYTHTHTARAFVNKDYVVSHKNKHALLISKSPGTIEYRQ